MQALRLWHLVIAGILLSVPLWAAANSEYVKSQHPPQTDLEKAYTSTDLIGDIPESLLHQYDAFKLLPSHLFPKWRRQYWPQTHQPFIDDVKFSVHPRFYYLHRDIYKGGVKESAAVGGSLGMETGWWNEMVRFGLTAYTSQRLYGPKDRDGVGLLADGQNGYTVLGEAYVDLKLGDTLVRAGRSRIDIPFINSWDFRMTPYTFEAVGFRNQSIPHLKIGGGHVFRIKTTTSTDFETMSRAAGVEGVDQGVTVLSLRYDFSDSDFIAMTEQYAWDLYNTFYMEGERFIELSDRWKFRAGAQVMDERSVGDALLGVFDSQLVGVKASFQYCNITTSLSFTKSWGATGFQKPWGSTPAYNSSILEDFDRAWEESFRVGVVYDFAPHGLTGVTIDTGWITGNAPSHGKNRLPDEQEYDVSLNYRPSSEFFDGVWFRGRYANSSMEDGSDIQDIRIELNYSYTF
jgi:hypothetical protein